LIIAGNRPGNERRTNSAKEGWLAGQRVKAAAVIESPRKKTVSSVPCEASCSSIWSIANLRPSGPGTAPVTVIFTQWAPAKGKRCARVRTMLPVTLTTWRQVPFLPSVESAEVEMV
jgi:hypothetical protein